MTRNIPSNLLAHMIRQELETSPLSSNTHNTESHKPTESTLLEAMLEEPAPIKGKGRSSPGDANAVGQAEPVIRSRARSILSKFRDDDDDDNDRLAEAPSTQPFGTSELAARLRPPLGHGPKNQTSESLDWLVQDITHVCFT